MTTQISLFFILGIAVLMIGATEANAQNMTLNGTQQKTQTRQNQTGGFGSLLGNIIGSAILHGLGAVENGTRSNGTTGPCLAHGSILGYIFGKFILQDEKIQLLEHDVTQTYAQQELVNKENKAFCNVTTTTTKTSTPPLSYAAAPPSIPNLMPIIINSISNTTSDKSFTNTTFYLNSTDGHYHLKGLIKNLLPETRDSIILTIDVQDKTTSDILHRVDFYSTNTKPIPPNGTTPFDIDLGFSASQRNELTHAEVSIT